MKNKGFTLIEMAIIFAIVGILLIIIFGRPEPTASKEYKNVYGELACINGYEYSMIGENVIQIINSNGQGIRCQK